MVTGGGLGVQLFVPGHDQAIFWNATVDWDPL